MRTYIITLAAASDVLCRHLITKTHLGGGARHCAVLVVVSSGKGVVLGTVACDLVFCYPASEVVDMLKGEAQPTPQLAIDRLSRHPRLRNPVVS